MLPMSARRFELSAKPCLPARQASNETLEIHSSPTFASHWLARNLGSFQLAWPEIAVRLLRVSKITDFNRDPADISAYAGASAPGPITSVTCSAASPYAPMLSPALAASIGGDQPSLSTC
jgi:LysR family glycine cleavage system transcriptional activator